MRLLVDIGHPAHVHFFKNFIYNMEKKGHEVQVTARDREVIKELLEFYSFKHKIIGQTSSTLFKKASSLFEFDIKLLKEGLKFKPDILTSYGSPYAAHASMILRRPHIVFGDTELAKLVFWLTYPFSEVICTPTSFLKDLGNKHIKYNGFKELAYLSPLYFNNEEQIYEYIDKNEKIILLRFISYSSFHDLNLKGVMSKLELIKQLEDYGRPIITSDYYLGKELEKYKIKIPPYLFHSLLNNSALYIGEGGTTAVEAALLGTPAIHIEADSKGQASGNTCGNFLDLRNKYNLLYFYPSEAKAIEKAKEILEDKKSKEKWESNRIRLLKDKIDVTAWMTDFIERYPDSFYEYKK